MSSVIENMSREQLVEIAKIAAEVSILAPWRQSASSARAGIDWETIHKLRATLERAGYAWKEGRKHYEGLIKEAKDKRRAPYATDTGPRNGIDE